MNLSVPFKYGSLALTSLLPSSSSATIIICENSHLNQTNTNYSVADYMVINKLGPNFSKLREFSKFEKNWNGYGGKTFSKATIDRTTSLLKKLNAQPKVFPTGRGTVQLEYHVDEENLMEMEISKDEISALWVIHGEEREEYIQTIFEAKKKIEAFLNTL